MVRFELGPARVVHPPFPSLTCSFSSFTASFLSFNSFHYSSKYFAFEAPTVVPISSTASLAAPSMNASVPASWSKNAMRLPWLWWLLPTLRCKVSMVLSCLAAALHRTPLHCQDLHQGPKVCPQNVGIVGSSMQHMIRVGKQNPTNQTRQSTHCPTITKPCEA